MNCLLCNYATDDLNAIEEHYIIYHRINKYNFFFRQLMLNKDGLLNTDCIRCQKFIPTKKSMSEHNFLDHYIDGEKKPTEFKAIDIIKKMSLQFITLILKNILMSIISIIRKN